MKNHSCTKAKTMQEFNYIEKCSKSSLKLDCIFKDYCFINVLRFFMVKESCLILLLFLSFSNLSQAQKLHIIEFNAEGKMTVAPPGSLPNGDFLQFKVNIDEASFEKRTLENVEFYLSTLEKLNQGLDFNFLFCKPNMKERFGYTISEEVKSITPYLSKSNSLVTNNRVKYYGFDKQDLIPNPPKFIPDHAKPKDLIQIKYSVKIDFFKASGEKIGETKSFNLNEIDKFPDLLKSYSLTSDKIPIDQGIASINFELREIEPKNEIIKDKAVSLNPALIKDLETRLSNAGKEIDNKFFALFKTLKERGEKAKKYLEDPVDTTINQCWLDKSNQLYDSLNYTSTKGFDELKVESVSDWMSSWLWLTQGTPKINPFFFQEEALLPKDIPTVEKVSEEEKVMVEMFDTMVKNGAFQIETLSNIFNESQLGQIATIKAKLKAEGVALPSAFEYDKFLYSGMINSYDAIRVLGIDLLSSRVPISYMASHNATLDFLLMSNYQKEIKDIDQLIVLIQNAKQSESFSIAVNTIAIETDNGAVTEEIVTSIPKGDDKNDSNTDYQNIHNQFFMDVEKFYTNFVTLNEKVEFFSSLQKAPKLPIVTVKDNVPSWETKIINYNQNIDAPSFAEYKIKSELGDEEKEVYVGKFRVNRLYNLRFKAGAVFSDLKQKDYTKTGDNTFTEEIETAGIDGTFGIQIFPLKTDIRQINIFRVRVAPFIYMGFSMKNILENFYPGVGLEIFSGLSVSYNRHIGISEELILSNSLPQDIGTKWKGGNSLSLLVDGALFVKLFKFGSNKGIVGF